ncbi:uncharacterized protein LOC110697764 [Chenopodium quinoa]|uniref:uncharacterized protein LOC110697764 n=1 Tax=Chenopodium quinoa TaxID=63459 RepID=UPI000B76E1CF|nr:uncharacterized protein LOC110697764 [Chenopodium quinoa]
MFSAIYASPDSTTRHELWRQLENIGLAYNGPWMLAGDFNDTMSMAERLGKGGSEMERRCKEFSDWVNNNQLIDLGCSGPEFTWCRGLSQAIFKASRLDRALVNDEWRLRYPEGAVPLKPFRFQAAWIKQEKFEEFVSASWDNTAPLFPFLKEFAQKLNHWNKVHFYNIFRKKYELWARLEGIQKALKAGAPMHILKLEEKLKKEMLDILEQEEIFWFQKSRDAEAICDGDRNTRFFHLSTIIRRRRNRIETLKDSNDEWVTDPTQVKTWWWITGKISFQKTIIAQPIFSCSRTILLKWAKTTGS